MARKTYNGLFNLNTLAPAIERAAPNAQLFLRAGPFDAATTIIVDARDLTQIDSIVAAHDPTVKTSRQNDFVSGVAKLKGLGLTDGEIAALGLSRATVRG